MSTDIQWTMNCVIFGAALFKKLSHGTISKADALGEIENLASTLTEDKALYLLKRVQDLVTS